MEEKFSQYSDFIPELWAEKKGIKIARLILDSQLIARQAIRNIRSIDCKKMRSIDQKEDGNEINIVDVYAKIYLEALTLQLLSDESIFNHVALSFFEQTIKEIKENPNSEFGNKPDQEIARSIINNLLEEIKSGKNSEQLMTISGYATLNNFTFGHDTQESVIKNILHMHYIAQTQNSDSN
ncbi:MAG: hypothetical protein N2558_01425 [Patescibacteria group bacterium]|nr:hypothetical protein [Patescibacteria group bacterium]